MKKIAIPLLIVSNLLTGLLWFVSNEKVEALTATRTTNKEREIYGAACVDWIREQGRVDALRAVIKVEDDPDGVYQLGRSWRKHGQMVFEVILPQAIREVTGDVLCTYDSQSEMMYAYTGAAKKNWLFY